MDELLSSYIQSFSKLNDLCEFPEIYPFVATLATGESGPYGMVRWKPHRSETHASLLEPIYAKLPARFPPLFERLLLTYRWAEVDLQGYRLLPNPLGHDLDGFFQQMAGNKGLWESLKPAGFIQFGRGPDIDYDPVCFDVSSRKKNREMRVVKIDHEEILCNCRIKVVAELAPSFEALAKDTIALANRKSPGE
jgi:hypothetical protein